MGTPVDFDSLLRDRDLTQKSHNILYNVRNNNNNVLKKFGKMHPLFTRCTAQLEGGGPVTSELRYCTALLSMWLYILAVMAICLVLSPLLHVIVWCNYPEERAAIKRSQ